MGLEISSMYFRYFASISPWKRTGPCFWTNSRILCATFGWNLRSDSGEEDFCLMYFFAISLLSPLGKGWGLSLNKLESLTPKDALCLAWLKIGQMVMEKKNFKFWQCIFATSLSSPLGKGRGPSFEKKLNPPHQRMLCAPLGSNWPNGSGGEDENVNSLQTVDGQKALIFQVSWKTWLHTKVEIVSTIRYNRQNWINFCSFVRGFTSHWRICQAYEEWRVANFDQYSALMAIERWGFFNVPHL